MVRCKTSYIALVTFLIMFSILFIKTPLSRIILLSKEVFPVYSLCLFLSKNCVLNANFD
nr:MAG TPA: hypothetical protein [Caudoviricetes sp.]